jgi:Helix-turn-helix domain
VADLLGMQRAVWRSTRSTTEKIVLLAILDFYSDSSPQPWPSVATLAARTSLGRTAVLDALASLEGNGVVAVRRVAGRPNHYDLSRIVAVLTAPAAPARVNVPGPVRETDGSVESPEVDAEQEPTAAVEQPVRDVDRSATQSSPPPGRDQSASRTGPVRLPDPKDPKKQPKKEATVVRARAPAERAEALAMPIAERARLVLDDPRAAQRLQPQRWSETRKIAETYGGAIGSERPLSEVARDSGLRAILVLLAAEYSVDDLAWVAGNVPKQAWWRSGDRVRGLGSLSIEVVSRALGERDGPQRTDLRRATSNPASAEERRIHRNTLFENAAAGRYGADVKRAAVSGVRVRELVDQLEQAELAGELQLEPVAGVAAEAGRHEPLPGLARGSSHEAMAALGGAGR